MACKKSGKLGGRYIELLKFLKDRPEGVRTETIELFFKLPKRTAYNRLQRLLNMNLVENIYPIWRIAKNQASYLNVATLLEDDKKNIQAHKFSFTLKLMKTPDWWKKRENKLIRLKDFSCQPVKWGHSPYQNLRKDGFLIQMFSSSIVFINQKQYWNDDPYNAFIEALEDALELLRFIEERFKFKFLADEVPQFSVRSMHMVKLKDSVAERCKKEGKGYEVSIDGEKRVWVDLSEPFGREAGHKNYAPEDLTRLQERDSDVLEKDPSLPSEVDKRISQITEMIGSVSQNQVQHQESMVYLDKNLKTHFEVLEGIKGAVKDLAKEVKKLKK